jgi:uncharacterized peroxidase-related enzyme
MPLDAQDALLASLVGAPLDHVAVGGADQALVRYAERLTLTPGSVGAADVDALRAAGLDDRAIHDACAIVAYFAFVNRIADGLGVELESSSFVR